MVENPERQLEILSNLYKQIVEENKTLRPVYEQALEFANKWDDFCEGGDMDTDDLLRFAKENSAVVDKAAQRLEELENEKNET